MTQPPPRPTRELAGQLLAYVAIGALTTALYYALWAGLFWGGVDYRIASGAGYGVGSFVNYGLQKAITFRDRSRGLAMGGQFLVYWLIVVASLGATVGLVWLGVAAGGLPEWLSVVAASVVMLAANFGAHRGVTFNPRLWDPVPTPRRRR
jgi:putative flippase GtrA